MNRNYESQGGENMVLEAIKMKEEKDLFGGSRPTDTVKLDTVDGIVNCYALGNEKASEGLYKFLKENGILEELENLGIEEGDTVKLYNLEFEYYR